MQKVLLVSANTETIKKIEDFFKCFGNRLSFEIIVAKNGWEAEAMLDPSDNTFRGPFNLVVVDLNIPYYERPAGSLEFITASMKMYDKYILSRTIVLKRSAGPLAIPCSGLNPGFTQNEFKEAISDRLIEAGLLEAQERTLDHVAA